MTGDPLIALREARAWIVEDDPGEADTGGFHARLVNEFDAALDDVEALIEASRAADGVIYALPRAVRTKRRQAVGTRLNRALARFPATSPAKEQA